MNRTKAELERLLDNGLAEALACGGDAGTSVIDLDLVQQALYQKALIGRLSKAVRSYGEERAEEHGYAFEDSSDVEIVAEASEASR